MGLKWMSMDIMHNLRITDLCQLPRFFGCAIKCLLMGISLDLSTLAPHGGSELKFSGGHEHLHVLILSSLGFVFFSSLTCSYCKASIHKSDPVSRHKSRA
ncbi:hypothetical protein ARMSODRAFT_537475 [Armillaria solidipes]|uniref:Uncharacterized protein n=1 Tax=Armillaria solidipes TaxID=1076256 RepID=A0A2H3BBV5_9AGAR|nr:hypothetical protein ARMSODRAFT_537475 [Armillaria solidipes]